MISKQEILQMATAANLSAQVIEKDYVLGWLLAAINQNPSLRDNWIFKGGTCLKKCYFKIYRFSEDLDFTLVNSSYLDELFLKKTFVEIADWLYEKSGIELPVDRMLFEQHKENSCQGRIFYRGPIAPISNKTLPRIKLDLTANEIIVENPILNSIHHGYSDYPEEFKASCYPYAEIFAEKIRALAERTRPRDLYDVINLYRRTSSLKMAQEVQIILEKKCAFKNIEMPKYVDLEKQKLICSAGWHDQLSYQLQELPSFESFWNELPRFFKWLDDNKS